MFESISLDDLVCATGGVRASLKPAMRAKRHPKREPLPQIDTRPFSEREPFGWSNMMSGGNI
jgi:hypothetical protein